MTREQQAELLYNFGMMLSVGIQNSGPTEQWDNLDICKQKVKLLADQWSNPTASEHTGWSDGDIFDFAIWYAKERFYNSFSVNIFHHPANPSKHLSHQDLVEAYKTQNPIQ